MENLTAPVPNDYKGKSNDLQLPTIPQQLTYPLDQVTQQILRDFITGSQLPIGSIYSNVTNSANPSTYLGYGTWTAVEGYVIAGYKSGDPDFGTAGATVGASTHTLSIAEMPAHDHTGSYVVLGNGGGGVAVGLKTDGGVANNNTAFVSVFTQGDGDPHNNIQPTLVAYVWQRTA